MERIRYYKRIVIASAVFAVLLAVSVAFPCAYARWVSGAETNVIGGTIGIASGTSKPGQSVISFDGNSDFKVDDGGNVNGYITVSDANRTLTVRGGARDGWNVTSGNYVTVQTVFPDYVVTFERTGVYNVFVFAESKQVVIVPTFE